MSPYAGRVRALLATVVLVAGLGGCFDRGSDGSDALYPIGSIHLLCIDSTIDGRPRHAFTEGLDTMANRGPSPVTITDVEWPTTGDVQLRSVRVFQRQRGDQFATLGLWGGLPQDGLRGSERRAWLRAQPAQGAVLDGADARQHYLVFALGITGTKGTGGPLTIRYSDADGTPGTVTSRVRFRTAPRCRGM